MSHLTTLIPAYKKDYLSEVFLGLQRQTFRDFSVILSDDSPGGEISSLIASGHFGALIQGLDLQVVPGPHHARLNHQALLDLWGGRSRLLHFHLDDDLIYPDFYQTHVDAHAAGTYGASISRRWISHLNTRPLVGIRQPAFVAASPLRAVALDAKAVFSSTVPTCNNWLGELSNMVFSAAGAEHYPQPPTADLNYYGWLDIGWLLELVQHQPLLFIRDHLGVYRQHPEQTTHHLRHHGGRVSSMAWIAYALAAWADDRISYAEAVNGISYTVGQCFKTYGEDDPVINQLYDIVQNHGGHLTQLHAAFSAFWLPLLASNPVTAPRTSAAAAGAAQANAGAKSAGSAGILSLLAA